MSDLPDVQQSNPNVNIPIREVGVENVEMPFLIESKYGTRYSTNGFHEVITNVSVRCSLDENTKGISMSRCIRTLQKYIKSPLKQRQINKICLDLKDNLGSNNIYLRFSFKLPIFRSSIRSGHVFPVYYNSIFEGHHLENNEFKFFQGMRIQYASYCPCSAELSNDLQCKGRNGYPHNQRSFASVIIQTSRNTGYVWLEDINELVEDVIPTLPYAIIKREDEQRIAEVASENPLFVEDAIRLISNSLDNRNDVLDWFVKCVHEESIHTSEAIAVNYKYDTSYLNSKVESIK